MEWLLTPTACPTGRFAYDDATGKWDWDDEVFRIHGYSPGSIRPTTDLVLASKHPEDRDRVMAQLDRAARTGEAFSISYRIVGADGVERRVVLVGEGGLCEPGETAVVAGFYIDLTSDFVAEADEAARHAVEESAKSRATIEQAKGVLMLAYGLHPDAAFAMLRWWSRNRRVKVRELAARLVEAAGDGSVAEADLRLALDSLLHDVTNEDRAVRPTS